MHKTIVDSIILSLKDDFDGNQLNKIASSLANAIGSYELVKKSGNFHMIDNASYLRNFISSKNIEGCSQKTLGYYESTIDFALKHIGKHILSIETDDIRNYLINYQETRFVGKVTMDNIRRILSSFFNWLEDEGHILKSPVRRIHKMKLGRTVKDVFSDEDLEKLRDSCDKIRDLAIVEMLYSTGMRVGELVRLNISDVNLNERECIVLGKGNCERQVYFDARTKLHLQSYLNSRTDDNEALFISHKRPYRRITISSVESMLSNLGTKAMIKKVHPHKFRRSMATHAIDRGMPIEQVQKLLGHVRIDTTLHYALVNQTNVKYSHKRYIG